MARDTESRAVHPPPVMWSIPTPDSHPPNPPVTLTPCPALPAPWALWLPSIPAELPVKKMGLEEGDAFLAQLASPRGVATATGQTHAGVSGERTRFWAPISVRRFPRRARGPERDRFIWVSLQLQRPGKVILVASFLSTRHILLFLQQCSQSPAREFSASPGVLAPAAIPPNARPSLPRRGGVPDLMFPPLPKK